MHRSFGFASATYLLIAVCVFSAHGVFVLQQATTKYHAGVKQPVPILDEVVAPPQDKVTPEQLETHLSSAAADLSAVFAVEHERLPVDLVPDAKRWQYEHTFLERALAPPRPARFRFISFARNAFRASSEGALSTHGAVETYWTLGFFVCLVAAGCCVWRICDQLSLESKQSSENSTSLCPGESFLADEEGLASARGRPDVVPSCLALVFIVCWAVFVATVITVHMVNVQVEAHPLLKDVVNDQYVTIRRSIITQPTRNAFEAGDGVVLSVAAAVTLAFAWRFYGQVQLSTSLLAVFCLRGATLSIAVALVCELVGDYVISKTGAPTPLVGDLVTMAVVGMSEEFAKLFAAVVGVYLTAEAFRKAASWYAPFLALVESRRAVMLCGFAVGFGFMIGENIEYVISLAATPPMTYSNALGEVYERQGEGAMAITMIVMIIVRVFLNCHPWWCGLSAARLANVLHQEGRDKALPRPAEFLWALAPSVALHATYDTLLCVGIPVVLALLTPPACWYITRQLFTSYWDEAEETAWKSAPKENIVSS